MTIVSDGRVGSSIAALAAGARRLMEAQGAVHCLQGRGAIWLIGNAVTLSAMMKGSFPEADSARASAALHFAIATRRCRMWF